MLSRWGILAVWCVTTVSAEEPTQGRVLAQRLFELSGQAERRAALLDAVIKMELLRARVDGNGRVQGELPALPAELAAQIDERVAALRAEEAGWWIDAYSAKLTIEQLTALTTFYESPTGVAYREARARAQVAAKDAPARTTRLAEVAQLVAAEGLTAADQAKYAATFDDELVVQALAFQQTDAARAQMVIDKQLDLALRVKLAAARMPFITQFLRPKLAELRSGPASK
jgi:hypothetical protein